MKKKREMQKEIELLQAASECQVREILSLKEAIAELKPKPKPPELKTWRVVQQANRQTEVIAEEAKITGADITLYRDGKIIADFRDYVSAVQVDKGKDGE